MDKIIRKKLILSALLLVSCSALFMGGAYEIKMQNIKSSVLSDYGIESEGTFYQNGVKLDRRAVPDFNFDVKCVAKDKESTLITDFANGYTIRLPGDTEFDFSMSEFGVRGEFDGGVAVISREFSPYEDVWEYIEYYYHRFLLAPEYQKNNNITMYENTTRNIGGKDIRIISLERTPYEGSEIKNNCYTYAYLLDENNPQQLIRVMLKTEKYDPQFIDSTIESLDLVERRGVPTYSVDTAPVLPKWNDETKALYEKLVSDDEFLWGVYTHKLINEEGMEDKVYELEEKLDYTFPLVMGYSYLYDTPPMKGLYEAYEAGKAIELTLQICTIDNLGLDSLTNPNFKVLDGQMDDTIASFARGIKEFGHPILFRLNNEMNTDWTSYAGVDCLCDSDIYKAVYRRVYDIFEKEGVDNVIWLFNPQYGNYPPASWNNYLCYYPGNEYVQMLGITAYNTGDYYYVENLEKWRSFSELYDAASELYMRDFADVPWIITEFSCSSNGGNKANWIKNMFYDIDSGKYPNIKGAVWFSHADYDFREGREGIVSRPYYLDENEEVIEAFSEGVHGEIIKKKLDEEVTRKDE